LHLHCIAFWHLHCIAFWHLHCIAFWHLHRIAFWRCCTYIAILSCFSLFFCCRFELPCCCALRYFFFFLHRHCITFCNLCRICCLIPYIRFCLSTALLRFQ
jgi:hypothetical protein